MFVLSSSGRDVTTRSNLRQAAAEAMLSMSYNNMVEAGGVRIFSGIENT